MSSEQNKAVVRRFTYDILAGGNVDLIDELVAPNYINHGLGGAGRGVFKEAVAGMQALRPLIAIKELVAEGDAVVARLVYELTPPGGEQLMVEGLTYYRLANGQIVEDDPMTRPDVFPELVKVLAPTTS